ncbi:hypothetical protein Tco_1164433 [Tanacetum coccineum]
MRIEESLIVTFDESLPEPKSSPSVEDDRIIEPVVQNPVRSPSLEANASDPRYPKSPKEARGHPIEQVIVCEGSKVRIDDRIDEPIVQDLNRSLSLEANASEPVVTKNPFEGNALDSWIPALEQGGARAMVSIISSTKISTF